MGVTNGASLIRPTKTQLHTLDDLKGKVVGVDISIVMHRALSFVGAAVQYHAAPQVAVMDIMSPLNNVFDAYESAGVMYHPRVR